MPMHIVADDLSGGAETAGTVAAADARGRVRRQMRVLLRADLAPADAEVVVRDTRTRSLDAAGAAQCVVRALGAAPDGAARFLKYDSLLRGHVGVELAAVASGSPVVFCPAVPELDRVVRDGVPRVAGVPLASSGLWALEPGPAPARVVDLFAPGAAVTLALDVVRGESLTERVAAAVAAGRVVCCDAAEASDLVRVAAAAQRVGAVLAGSSSLAAALAGLVLRPPGPPVVADVRPAATLALIGSASPRALAQAEALRDHGGRVVLAEVDQLGSLRVPAGDVTVLVSGALDPSAAPRVLGALAALADQADGRHLVLSGGETARAVLDAAGVGALTPVLVPHLGAVVSVTDDGRVVATRPGSFGPDSSLVDIRDAVAGLVGTSKEVTT